MFNQLLFSIFNGNDWVSLGSAISGFLGRMFYYAIMCGIAKIADLCQLIFRKFAGISSSGVNIGSENRQGDIVIAFIESKTVQNLFFALLILAIIILFITTFTAIIRTEFAKDGNNNKKKVIKNAFRGILNFVAVPVICMFALFVGNALLGAINGATSSDSAMLSNQIFMAGAYNGNRARNSEISGDANQHYATGSFGALLAGTSGIDLNGYGNFGIFLDDTSGINQQRAADKIDMCFSHGYAIKVSQGLIKGDDYTSNLYKLKQLNVSEIPFSDSSVNSNTIDYSKTDFWNDGMLLNALNIAYSNESGDHDASVKTQIVFSEGDVVKFSIYNVGLVYYYYDLTFGGFNYLIATIALIFCAWTLLTTVLGLIKRIFMLATLFIISPPICAMYPLDEGKALGTWRGAFIKEVLSAYSVVVIMNIFLVLVPIFQNITLFISDEIGALTGFANYMAQVLIILGGLTFFKEATKSVSTIIGAGNAYEDSTSSVKNFTGNVARAAAGVALGAGLAVGAGKFVGKTAVGTKNAIQGYAKGVSQRKDEKFKQSQLDAMGESEGKAIDSSAAGTSGAEKNSMNTVSNSSAPKTNLTQGTSNEASSESVDSKASSLDRNWHAERLAFNKAEKEKNREEKYDKKKGQGAYAKHKAEQEAEKEQNKADRHAKFEKFKENHKIITKLGRTGKDIGKSIGKASVTAAKGIGTVAKAAWTETKIVGNAVQESFGDQVKTAKYMATGDGKSKPKMRDTLNLKKSKDKKPKDKK